MSGPNTATGSSLEQPAPHFALHLRPQRQGGAGRLYPCRLPASFSPEADGGEFRLTGETASLVAGSKAGSLMPPPSEAAPGPMDIIARVFSPHIQERKIRCTPGPNGMPLRHLCSVDDRGGVSKSGIMQPPVDISAFKGGVPVSVISGQIPKEVAGGGIGPALKEQSADFRGLVPPRR